MLNDENKKKLFLKRLKNINPSPLESRSKISNIVVILGWPCSKANRVKS